MMKVDVEGMEAAVLQGARGVIAKCQPALYLENQCASSSPALMEVLATLNYICFWDPAPYFSENNFMRSPRDDQVRGEAVNPGISLNMLCLHREDGSALSGTLDLWLALCDVVHQLKRIDPRRPFVEDYNPIPIRTDVKFGTANHELLLEMAKC
jgi:hypothetical protein